MLLERERERLSVLRDQTISIPFRQFKTDWMKAKPVHFSKEVNVE